MKFRWILTWAAAGALVLFCGCKSNQGTATVIEAPVIEEERPNFGSAEEQQRRAEEAAAAGTPAGQAASVDKAWGVKVAELMRRLATTVGTCNDKYFKALKPDELLVGKPALVTTDGVVTVMADACDGIVDDLALGLLLLDGKHPKADQLMRQWTLLADMYRRVSKSAINAGARPRRRKLNHGEMIKVLPIITKELAPGVVKASMPFLKLGEDDQESPPSIAFQKISQADIVARWRDTMDKTTVDLLALKAEYMEKVYDLKMGDLFARKRYMRWLDGTWKRRLALQKLTLARVTTNNSGFDDKLKAAIGKYHAAVDAYLAAGWAVGMLAMEDKDIDEDKLKAGKDGFVKAGKVLQKAVKKIKLPKA